MRIPFRATLLIGAALLIPASAVLIAQPRADPRPYCRVTAQALPTSTPGQYQVRWTVRPECPPDGHAFVRLESGRIYPWREVQTGAPVLSRPVPWYWKSKWRSASGKKTYEIRLPGMRPPWERP